MIQFGEGNDFGQRAFQLTDVGFDVGSNVFDDFIINIVAIIFFSEFIIFLL